MIHKWGINLGHLIVLFDQMLVSYLLEIGNDGFFWNAVGVIPKSNCGNFII